MLKWMTSYRRMFELLLTQSLLRLLIEDIECCHFESEAGPLENCLDWIELKARIARLLPKPH
jgi:hypothetical protein